MIPIAVINSSTVMADADVQAMLPAFDQQWNKDLKPLWGLDDAQFKFVPAGTTPDPSAQWLVFLDDSDQANALAYHDLSTQGLPLSKVFVKTILADKASVSVGASHELCEMAVDPWLNGAYQDSNGTFWAGEVCDPVEDDQYGYKIGAILVSDFVTPNWFAHKYAQGSLDLKGYSKSQFEVLSGGYAQYFDPQRGWVQTSGSLALKSARAQPSAGSRRERRMRGQAQWKRSEPTWYFKR